VDGCNVVFSLTRALTKDAHFVFLSTAQHVSSVRCQTRVLQDPRNISDKFSEAIQSCHTTRPTVLLRNAEFTG